MMPYCAVIHVAPTTAHAVITPWINGVLIISVQPSPPHIPRLGGKTCVPLPLPSVGQCEVVDAVEEEVDEEGDE